MGGTSAPSAAAPASLSHDAERALSALGSPARPSGWQLPIASIEILRQEADDADASAEAINTSASYRSDQSSWEGFCRTFGFEPYPADVEHVRLYLTQLVTHGGRGGRPLRPRSAERHLAGIASAHLAKDLPFQRDHPRLVRCMSGLKRKYGVRQHGADPIRTEAVQRICQLMGADPLAVRDRALLLIGYAGGFRRSALVSLDVGDVQFVDQGVILRLARDKDDQEGEGRLIGILAGTNPETCPVLALRAWWRVAGHHHATRATPLFTSIDRWGVIDIMGDRLSDKAVDRAIKRWARRIGLAGAYSAHSLRAGHVTEARDRGGRNVRAQQQLGHASADTTDRYDRAEIWERNSSGFLGL